MKYQSGEEPEIGDIVQRPYRARIAEVIGLGRECVRIQNIHGLGTDHENRTNSRAVNPDNYVLIRRKDQNG